MGRTSHGAAARSAAMQRAAKPAIAAARNHASTRIANGTTAADSLDSIAATAESNDSPHAASPVVRLRRNNAHASSVKSVAKASGRAEIHATTSADGA